MAIHLSKNLSFAFFVVSLALSISSSSSSPSLPKVGVTYTAINSSSDNLLHHRHVVSALQSMKLNSVRLPESDPETTRMFSYSGVSVLLCIPNSLIREIAANQSNAIRWLNRHVVPFYPRVQISIVSVGNDVNPLSDLSDFVLPAMENVQDALHELGIRKISVSTTFSFARVITSAFPPSSASFQESVSEALVKPILDFIAATNSSFLINLYPYHLYRCEPQIPIGFALFQQQPFNFRDDPRTGFRYQNLFDMMVDAVISAIESRGHHRVPVVVTETGWPSSDDANQGDAKDVYAEMYVKGLVRHLRSGVGTPLRRDGVAEVYIYELFDGGSPSSKWGIMHDNMTQKYNVDFSGSAPVVVNYLPMWYLPSLVILYATLRVLPN